MTRGLLAVATCLALAGKVLAAPVPCGVEFQVNTHTTSTQGGSRVAALADGGFVVVWSSYGDSGDADATSVQAQRFDGLGVPLGAQFQVNTYTTGAQTAGDVAALPDGGFLVTFRSAGSLGSDADGSSVQARRYDAAGAPLGAEFQVNTYTTGPQSSGRIGVDAAGNFAIVWTSLGSAGSDTDADSIQLRTFDAGVRKSVAKEFRRVVEGVAKGLGARAEVHYEFFLPATVNDAAMTDLAWSVAEDVVGKRNVVASEPSMGGEDMSLALEAVPGVFAFVGGSDGTRRTSFPHHHPSFDVHEDCLPVGAAFLESFVRRWLREAS